LLELTPRPRLQQVAVMIDKLCVPVLRGNHDEQTFRVDGNESSYE
jgi:hypothetical protein